jgi:glycosyltransferase involved in cell wall biosynthesis
MNLVATSSHRFQITPDGAVWTATQFAYPVWARFLEVFDSVRVLARARPAPSAPAGWLRADGDRVTFAPMPDFVGPWQYFLQARTVRRALHAAVGPADAVLLHGPGIFEHALESTLLRPTGRPFAVEVVTDPYDMFAPGSVRHVLRPFFRWWLPRVLRRLCRNAVAAAYVTKEALQRRYPCPNHSAAFSDVELAESSLAEAPRPPRPEQRAWRLVMVGGLAQLYKAPHVLIDAVAECVAGGLGLTLTFIGDGRYRPRLEAQAAAHGLGERVQFLGQLPAGAAVRAQLDQADLFVLPSFQEGLPRAMVEAMARALPCVGSTVGGIPELLAAEDLVPPGGRRALAAKIREVVTDPARLARMSARNLETAKQYTEAALHGPRVAFLQYLRDRTAEWARRPAGQAPR